MALPYDSAVIDTSVVSILLNAHADKAKREFYRRQTEGVIGLMSFQARAELLFGAFNAGWDERRMNALLNYIARYQLIGVDDGIIRQWARIKARSRRHGSELSAADAWIAATALSRGVPFVSDDRNFANAKDAIGLELVIYEIN